MNGQSAWAAKQAAKQQQITDALEDRVRDALIQNGFAPADDSDGTLPADLHWIPTYGWHAYRDNGAHVDLCRFSEDGIYLTRSARNYVILTEATFNLTGIGVDWLNRCIAP